LRDPNQLIDAAQDAIAAHGRYAEAEFDALPQDSPGEDSPGEKSSGDGSSGSEIAVRRREAGVATNALEASINRALIERSGKRDVLEAVLVIDVALRRFSGRLAVMGFDPTARSGTAADLFQVWKGWVVNAMLSLGTGATELPPRPEAGEVETLTRLGRQIELIAGAMRRLAG